MGTTAPIMPHAIPNTAPRGWAVYARLSRKKVGRAKKRRNELETVERQIAEIRAWAARMGMVISELHIYIDNHLSAWKEDGRRPAFDAMIAAAERGEFVGIAVWKIDRFTRRVADALAFIRIAEKHAVLVDGPSSGRYDLSTPDGRKKLRDDASAAEHESDVISLRVTTAFNEMVPLGLQLGRGRQYGFKVLSEHREYDDDVLPVQHPDEVAIIREVVKRYLADETWMSIAADLAARGIKTVNGKPWQSGHLARMVGSPHYGGHIVQRGKIIGTRPGEPILDDDTYARLHARLAEARAGRKPAVKDYPLSGLARCGRCKGGRRTLIGGRREAGQRRYRCSTYTGGCGVSIAAEHIEGAVRDAVIRCANDPDTRARIAEADRAAGPAREALWQQLGEAEAEVDRLDGELADLEEGKMRGTVRAKAYDRAKAAADGLIAEAEAEAERLRQELAGTGGGGGDLPAITAEDWEAAPGEEKRAMVERFRLTVTVHPLRPGRSRKIFDPERVVIRAR